MPKPVKTYDLKSVYLIIGGYRIGGYGAAGGITFAYGADIAAADVGADGEAVISRLNNNSMTCEITVMETSQSYQVLGAMMQAQILLETFTTLEFFFVDELNGDTVIDPTCVFLTRPTQDKGIKAGERKFKVFLANGAVAQAFGAAILI